MPKLKDIAVIAGVSISTVSKALNNSSEIKKETKANIIRIARSINYDLGSLPKDTTHPNSHSIGVICPEIDSNYYTQLISSIGTRISRSGYHYTVAISGFMPEKEERYLEFFGSQAVDGIVLITENREIQKIIDGIKDIWSIPLVLITTEKDVSNYDCIRIDDYQGVKTGIEYLIRLGHQKIGFIGDNLADARLQAYRDILRKNNLPIQENYVCISDQRFEACGYQGMTQLLSGKDQPTAVFAAYDAIAVGAMRVITEQGLSVPEDISVIGMDNVTICPYLCKSLTTVSNPIKEMADVSIDILSRKIEDKSFTVIQNVILKPALVIRESTARIIC